jgi:hypothetical protein
MELYMSLFVAVLFFVLTPGVLLRLPTGGSKLMVAGVHALVFALVFGLTHKLAMDLLYKEGFADAVKGCPKGHSLCADKKCKEKC